MNKTLRAAAHTLGSLALASLCANAHASWTLSNDSGGDGSIVGAYPAFILTGSDNGDPGTSGFDNTTFYTQTFAAATTVTFTWQYASADSSGVATYDPAGYLTIDGGVTSETQLSIDALATSSGAVTVPVAAGETFGFYVHSLDSLFGAGMLAINEDLPPPPPPPSVPEPQEAALMLAGLAALFAAARRRRNG